MVDYFIDYWDTLYGIKDWKNILIGDLLDYILFNLIYYEVSEKADWIRKYLKHKSIVKWAGIAGKPFLYIFLHFCEKTQKNPTSVDKYMPCVYKALLKIGMYYIIYIYII